MKHEEVKKRGRPMKSCLVSNSMKVHAKKNNEIHTSSPPSIRNLNSSKESSKDDKMKT